MLQVIRVGRLIDGTGAAPIERAAIVVEDGRIREAGPASQVREPQGNEVQQIDCSDYTVLPGLIDCHVHLVFSAQASALQDILSEGNRRILLRAVHNAQLALRTGVTTVRDCGGRAGLTFELRDAIDAGILPGPRIFAAGPPITTTGGHCYFLEGEADTADDLRRLARTLAKQGCDFYKVMSTGGRMTPGSNVSAAQFSVDELSSLVAEARRLNRTVAAHGQGTAGIRNAVAAGVTTIEHCTWVSEEDSGQVQYDPDVAAQMARQGTFVNPTLSPGLVTARLPESEMTPVRRETRAMRPKINEAHRASIAAGVEIVAGTDAGVANVPLDSMPLELEGLHEELGLVPLDVIKAATHTAARACDREQEFGSIQPGRRADLLVVDGDPSRDIRAIRRVRYVFRDGTLEVEDGRLVRS
ncbi:MAG: amidohydrolase family protein [Chloroflexota bacterium]|nr:amidohydrolase family protein [Chloroflexota bacterium]